MDATVFLRDAFEGAEPRERGMLMMKIGEVEDLYDFIFELYRRRQLYEDTERDVILPGGIA